MLLEWPALPRSSVKYRELPLGGSLSARFALSHSGTPPVAHHDPHRPCQLRRLRPGRHRVLPELLALDGHRLAGVLHAVRRAAVARAGAHARHRRHAAARDQHPVHEVGHQRRNAGRGHPCRGMARQGRGAVAPHHPRPRRRRPRPDLRRPRSARLRHARPARPRPAARDCAARGHSPAVFLRGANRRFPAGEPA